MLAAASKRRARQHQYCGWVSAWTACSALCCDRPQAGDCTCPGDGVCSSMEGGDASSADPHSYGFGWEPRSMPLASSLTGTLSDLLDDQLQQWTMSNTEMDNTLQQQEALVASLVNDVESALGEERQKRQSIAQTLDAAKTYVEARRMGPVEFDDYFERLESIGAIVDNDFEEDEADDPSEALLHQFEIAGEKCDRANGATMSRCRMRFRRMNLSPEELFNLFDTDGSGHVDVEEFLSVVKRLDVGHVEALFHEQDKDHSGKLDDREVLHLAKRLGKVLTAAELAEAMRDMDPSGDGYVDLDEFITWWTRQTESSGGVLGDAMLSHASAMDQDYRWFFAAIDADEHDAGEHSDGSISLKELSAFVWAWEPETEYRIGDLVILWPQGAAAAVVYSAQCKGKSGTDTPDWEAGMGGAEEDGASSIKDGEVTWIVNSGQTTRMGELSRKAT